MTILWNIALLRYTGQIDHARLPAWFSLERACTWPLKRLSPVWVFAIILLLKNGLGPLFAPDLLASASGVCSKGHVSFRKISINRHSTFVNRLIITVVEDCFRHPAKYRFNYIQELGPCRQRHKLD